MNIAQKIEVRNGFIATKQKIIFKVEGSKFTQALKAPTSSNVHCLYLLLFHCYKSIQTMYIWWF